MIKLSRGKKVESIKEKMSLIHLLIGKGKNLREITKEVSKAVALKISEEDVKDAYLYVTGGNIEKDLKYVRDYGLTKEEMDMQKEELRKQREKEGRDYKRVLRGHVEPRVEEANETYISEKRYKVPKLLEAKAF